MVCTGAIPWTVAGMSSQYHSLESVRKKYGRAFKSECTCSKNPLTSIDYATLECTGGVRTQHFNSNGKRPFNRDIIEPSVMISIVVSFVYIFNTCISTGPSIDAITVMIRSKGMLSAHCHLGSMCVAKPTEVTRLESNRIDSNRLEYYLQNSSLLKGSNGNSD